MRVGGVVCVVSECFSVELVFVGLGFEFVDTWCVYSVYIVCVSVC